MRDGSALPTWYVYGNMYDATIWVDNEQLDGRTAEFVVYEKVWGVKPDLGPRDSAATNWKKIQKALKIDVAAANLRPHPEIFDRVTEIRDVMRVAQTKMRRESMLLRVNTAREILACNLATRVSVSLCPSLSIPIPHTPSFKCFCLQARDGKGEERE